MGYFQEDRNRYAPPQKQARIPLYHPGSNMSRVSNYGDVIDSNSSNRFSDSSFSQSNTNYQKPYGNPNNPQLVPLPNRSNIPIRSPNFVPNANRFNPHPPVSAYTNFPNSIPMNHSIMISVVSQAIPQQPIVGKDLSALLSVFINEKEKQNSSNSDQSPLGLDFDPAKLKVRHESVINSLYSDMPRQCSSCGVRFKCQEDHSKHLDWHVRKNRMMKEANKTTTRGSQKPKKSRDWFASTSLWLSAANGGTVEAAKVSFNANGGTQKRKEVEEEEECVVPANEKRYA